MMGMRTLFCSILLVAASAEAAEPGKALRLETGAFGPFGFGGLSYSHPLGERGGIETGFGLGVTGLQLPVLLRAWLGSTSHRFAMAAGPGLSLLPESKRHPLRDEDDVQVRDGPLVALWANMEVGYERRIRGGFNFLIGAGLGIPTVSNAAKIQEGPGSA